jgi:hypothetical protein
VILVTSVLTSKALYAKWRPGVRSSKRALGLSPAASFNASIPSHGCPLTEPTHSQALPLEERAGALLSRKYEGDVSSRFPRDDIQVFDGSSPAVHPVHDNHCAMVGHRLEVGFTSKLDLDHVLVAITHERISSCPLPVPSCE